MCGVWGVGVGPRTDHAQRQGTTHSVWLDHARTTHTSHGPRTPMEVQRVVRDWEKSLLCVVCVVCGVIFPISELNPIGR